MRRAFFHIATVSSSLLIAAILITQTCSAQHYYCADIPISEGKKDSTDKLVDRFNRPWHPAKHLTTNSSHSTVQSESCGGFSLVFEDVILATGIGFDDQTPALHAVMGQTTVGAIRRRTVCEVMKYIGDLIRIKGSPDIIIRHSMSTNNGILGVASPFFTGIDPISSGTLYDHITTGIDPTPSIGDFDAFIAINFFYDWNSDWTIQPEVKFDLYSVVLHEVTHALGFMSLIGSNGQSNIGGSYSDFDLRLLDEKKSPLINSTTFLYQSPLSALTSEKVVFSALACSGESSVYSPPYYQAGSSLSHFDGNSSGKPYVMHPSTSGGPRRVYTNEELQVLCDLGYDLNHNLCGNCAPRGTEDFGFTLQGTEICLEVLLNDTDPDSDPLSIQTTSIEIESGGGSVRVEDQRLCYTPAPGFQGVARLLYRPYDGYRAGDRVRVEINVVGDPSWPVSGRKDAFIWYFGKNAGISFQSGIPVPITDSKMNQLEGSAVICNPRTGSLLFYTDGNTVWDRDHNVMPNGKGLLGHYTSSQSALIVPNPGDTNTFYIFTVGAGFYTEPNNNGFRFSIVDMTANNGKGEVTSKNILLLDSTAEKLSATRHCNGNDYWIVVHKIGSADFYSYHLSSDGLSAPVISHTGIVYKTGKDLQGIIKFSPQAKSIAVTSAGPKSLELFDFDNSTGRIFNPRTVADTRYDYGVEFSPDGSKLYVAPLPPPNIPTPLVQYDLSSNDLSTIQSSATILHSESDSWDGAQLQLGPDNKIYVSFYGRQYLGVVTQPNQAGTKCNYIHDGITLNGRTTQYGLPNLIGTDLFEIEPRFMTYDVSLKMQNKTIDFGDTITLQVRICNTGVQPGNKVQVELLLPSGLQYISGLNAYPYERIDQLLPQECRNIVVTALATSSLPVNTPTSICLSVTEEENKKTCVSVDSNCVFLRVDATDILVNKEVERLEASLDNRVEYKVTVANQGPVDASNLVVEDRLPAALTYVSHVIIGSATFNPTTGTISIPFLPIGEKIEVLITCKVLQDSNQEILNCASLQSLDQIDLDLSNNNACIGLNSDTCSTHLTGKVSIGKHHSSGNGETVEIPVTLTGGIKSMQLTHIKLKVEYDSNIMVLSNTDDAKDLIDNTLLEGWDLIVTTDTPGLIEIEAVAPSDHVLQDEGVILILKFRMYLALGTKLESDLPVALTTPEQPCTHFMSNPGHASIDSLCGLSFRLIEISGAKYSATIPGIHLSSSPAKFKFSVALDNSTTIQVVDTYGKIVATLVNDFLLAGEYEATWDASELPAGLYFYYIHSGEWEAVERCFIVK